MPFQLRFAAPGFALSCGTADENIRIGPLRIWLGWSMQSIAWAGRFDLMCERTDYRPAQGQLVETWRESPEVRGGHLFGRTWRLLTGPCTARTGR